MNWSVNLKRDRWGRVVCQLLVASVFGLVVLVSPSFFSGAGHARAQEAASAIKAKEVDPLETLSKPQRELYQRKRAVAVAEAKVADKTREADDAEDRFNKAAEELNRPKREDETQTEYAGKNSGKRLVRSAADSPAR